MKLVAANIQCSLDHLMASSNSKMSSILPSPTKAASTLGIGVHRHGNKWKSEKQLSTTKADSFLGRGNERAKMVNRLALMIDDAHHMDARYHSSIHILLA